VGAFKFGHGHVRLEYQAAPRQAQATEIPGLAPRYLAIASSANWMMLPRYFVVAILPATIVQDEYIRSVRGGNVVRSEGWLQSRPQNEGTERVNRIR
jgi:hypothetical protein